MKKWVEELQANGPKDIILAVVGNKIDKCDEEEVDYASVKEYASSLGALLKLVSAKEGKNIDVNNEKYRIYSTLWVRWPLRGVEVLPQQLAVVKSRLLLPNRTKRRDVVD